MADSSKEVITQMHGNFEQLSAMAQSAVDALNMIVDMCSIDKTDSKELMRFKRSLLLVVRGELGKLI
jgi:hypothetical protein